MEQNIETAVPKKRKRRFFKWAGWIILSIILLALAGTVFEPALEAMDKKAYPPPGKMVDIGGYKLHINCKGTGSPTVIIESGWGNFSSVWAWVQPKVAKKTRVCAYDRAGMGWSESSNEPRTARNFAKELNTLLKNAGEQGPYILVGHSLGGYTVIVYAHDYPNEVAGLILVDSQALPTNNSSTTSPAPKPGRSSPLVWLAHTGIFRLLARPLGAVADLPQPDKGAYKAYSVTPHYVQTFLDEGRGMSEGGAQAKEVTTLGSLPLIVLSRGKDQDENWKASQEGFVKLSTNSDRFFAEKSGHGIMLEQPEAATGAILKMLEQVQQQPKNTK